MLFKREVLDRIRSGEVTLAFRRWRRPTVKAGGRLRTAAGELAIEAVERIVPEAITDDDARRAGQADRAALLTELGRREGDLYRIAFRLSGADPRVALRTQARIGEAELSEIVARLDRLDRASREPWTRQVLTLIQDHAGRPARELAAMRRADTAQFKRRVRQLKELGLTESLDVGYRLSPRGARLLARLDGA